MKTLKQLHAYRLLAESNNRLFMVFQQLKALQAKAEKGEIQPCKARREYNVLIARAAFYDNIAGRLCAEYNLQRTRYPYLDCATFFESK